MLDNPDIRNTIQVWTEMIDAAKTSIDFKESYISNQPGESLERVLKSVTAAAERGVRIRFIVDAGMYKIYPVTVDSLGKIRNIAVQLIDYRKLAGGIQH